MQKLLDRHRRWAQKFVQAQNPYAGQTPHQVWVRHEQGGSVTPPYAATLYAPPHLDPLGSLRAETGPTSALPAGKRHKQGRWVRVADSPQGEAHRVYLHPASQGDKTVAHGAGGVMNGLRLSGIKSDDEYLAHQSASRRQDRATQDLMTTLRQKQMARDAEVEPPLLPQLHVLPLRPEQAVHYAHLLHAVSQAKAYRDAAEPIPVGILAALAPEQLTDEIPPEQAQAYLYHHLEAAEDQGMDRVLQEDPYGARADWTSRWVKKYPTEPVQVISANPMARSLLAMRLGEEGVKVTQNPHYFRGDDSDQGDPTAHVLVTDHEIDPGLSKPYHTIYHDAIPAMPEVGKHASVHVLATDAATNKEDMLRRNAQAAIATMREEAEDAQPSPE